MKLTAQISRNFSLSALVFIALSLYGCENEDSVLERKAVSDTKPPQHFTATSWKHPVIQYATTAVVPISLGNQTVDLMPDTGSFDLLVTSVLCKRCGRTAYKATESENFHLERPVQSKTFHFGTGDLQALRAYDHFQAGPFDVQQMPMWLINKLSPELYDAFDSSEMQGVLGLGLRRSTAAQEMRANQFSLCLHRYSMSSWWNGGVLHWNGWDESLDWSTPLSSQNNFHWQLKAEKVSFGQTELCQYGTREIRNLLCSAIVDSGTSILAVPHQTASKLQQALPVISDDCDLAGLPDLHLAFEQGVSLSLPPAAYVMKFKDEHDMQKYSELADSGLIVWRRPAGSTLCAPVFQVTSSGSWVLGMPLFRAYAVHLDRSSRSISFAKNEGGKCSKEDSKSSFMNHKRRHDELDSAIEIPAGAFVASIQRRESHRYTQAVKRQGLKFVASLTPGML